MPEVPVTPPQAGAQGAPSAENPAPAPVTREEFTALTKQINGLSAALRVVQKAPAAPAAEAEPTAEQRVTLKSLQEQIQEKDRKTTARMIRAEVLAFAKANDITDADLFLDHVLARHTGDNAASRITVSDNDEVVFTDDLGAVKPFSELGKTILRIHPTFRPAVETPGQVGQRHQQGVTLPAGSKPVSEMTVADMQKNMAGTAQALGAALAHLQRQ